MKKCAFTMIELIIVVIVIALLAAIAMSFYSRWPEKARLLEAKVNLAKLIELEHIYYSTHGKWGIYSSEQDDLYPDTSPPAREGDEHGNCQNSSYCFNYFCKSNPDPDPTASCFAVRCTQGGKKPNYPTSYGFPYWLAKNTNGNTSIVRFPPGECANQGDCSW